MPLSEIYILDIDDKARCCKCREIKSKDDFYANKRRWNGIRNDCKICSVKTGNRNYSNRTSRDTGWTPEAKRKAFQDQDGRCAICKKHQDDLFKKLSGDHDHKTSATRSLLCNNCNLMIGLALDDPMILQAGADYLIHHAIIQESPVLDNTSLDT